MDKLGGAVDRMYMKLGSKFLGPLRVETQLLKRLQCAVVVNGASSKRMVRRVTEAP